MSQEREKVEDEEEDVDYEDREEVKENDDASEAAILHWQGQDVQHYLQVQQWRVHQRT